MAWAKPEFKPEQVNAAAKKLATMEFPVVDQEGLENLSIINNWRSSHAYPLNTFQITLRTKARKIEREVIVAQRSKRLESIHKKLVSKPTMRMTQMQDIAGCRAVFTKVKDVYKLVSEYKTSRFDHKFRNEKDYIANPKPDGYRCYHLVYEYKGTRVETAAYSGLRVEIQIRSKMQHAWATAVEAVGIFTKQALKSNQGNQDWLRFFSLMGSAIAAIESTAPVPETPTTKAELVTEISQLATQLHVKEMLQAYNATITTLGSAKDEKYFIVEMDPEQHKITVRRYKARQSEEANKIYTELESRIPDSSSTQVVLVSVENINALKRAYPNYFLDTNNFSKIVDRVLKGNIPEPQPHAPLLL
ncbi:RelA/SpoT domain-containing protein [Pseudomonas schmalbachii]|uniref:RelA/SpoT domain-containing protein n=1 Tax=Pseudomonas schmalbachii TaxID=2816993 RepID=A0ABS3TKX6_9PSED|nr:RelA/SpoT domain-containing protein [Pseudomonas schmalbachii]MBO3274310.1 RelA/SpoT domain-containing protein [Pseudomonas schmalbachii]